MIAEHERAKILERSRRGRRHAARSGLVSALGTAPFGCRYVTRALGGGVARFEVVEEEARIVQQIIAWVSLGRVSLHEVCRRLAEAGHRTRTGLGRWAPTTVSGMPRNPTCIGQAMVGWSRFVAAQPRLRPIRGRPWPPRHADGSFAGPAAPRRRVSSPPRRAASGWRRSGPSGRSRSPDRGLAPGHGPADRQLCRGGDRP